MEDHKGQSTPLRGGDDDIESTTLHRMGIGVRRYSGESTLRSAFKNPTAGTPEAGTGNSDIEMVRVETQADFHKLTNKNRTVGINLGFMQLGANSQHATETKFHEHIVNFVAYSKRIGYIIPLAGEREGKLIRNRLNKRALSILDDANMSPEEKMKKFYANYGSEYTAEIHTGLWAAVHIYLECSNKEEADKKAKELKATVETEDGSGHGSFSNNADFEKAISDNKFKLRLRHNIPAAVLKDPGFYDLTTQKGKLELIDNLAKISEEHAMPIQYIPLSYDFAEDFWGDTLKEKARLVTEELDVVTRMAICDTQLGRIEKYRDCTSDFEELEETKGMDVGAKKAYVDDLEIGFKNEQSGLTQLMRKLDADITYQLPEEDKKNLLELAKSNVGIELKYVKVDMSFKKISKSRSSQGDDPLLNNLVSRGDYKHLVKFAAADRLSTSSVGYVFYNTTPLQTPSWQPGAQTKWKKTDTVTEAGDAKSTYLKLAERIVEEMNKLTPTELFYCSVLFTDAKEDKNPMAMTVYYPEVPS